MFQIARDSACPRNANARYRHVRLGSRGSLKSPGRSDLGFRFDENIYYSRCFEFHDWF